MYDASRFERAFVSPALPLDVAMLILSHIRTGFLSDVAVPPFRGAI
ncbi:hypothetical protein RISK_001819 [Rhodopirellula islandica]|uniref:Uncharacterized protein n=1 Tax=Rhodopirellula islandica TaxID=595434 RepID=A0A0J1BHJ4_RHOIS|nr:hypothetical protein RISK_001819 [Rhodopirellula islandica]